MTDWHVWGRSAGADRVRALVSGLPGDKSRLKVFMVLQAFIDDSADGTQDKVFCLGGYVATAENWAAFSKEWDEFIKGWRLPAYKFVRQDRTTYSEIDASFYRIIEKYDIPVSVDVVINIPIWNKVADQIPWPRRNGQILELEKLVRQPYFIASKMLMWGLFNAGSDIGLSGPIDLIFDEQLKEKRILMDGWDFFKHTASSEMKRMIGAPPKFENDNDFPPLQAADLIVGHVRQYEESGDNSVGKYPFPWKPEKPIPIKRLAIRPTEEKLTQEINWICHPTNFEKLKKFSPHLFF